MLSDFDHPWLDYGEVNAADNIALLEEFIDKNSKEAFRGLVERYLPLIYSAAMRQVGAVTAPQ
jgi:hypothetical protein